MLRNGIEVQLAVIGPIDAILYWVAAESCARPKRARV